MKTTGDGTVALQSQDVHTGAVAAELSESSNDGSTALMRKTLTWSQHDLTASGNFRVAAEGADGGSVPFFTFLDSRLGEGRERCTGSTGAGGSGSRRERPASRRAVRWRSTRGARSRSTPSSTGRAGSSGVKVRLNGTLIFQTTYASLGARMKTVQLGNDIPAQEGTVVADDISRGQRLAFIFGRLRSDSDGGAPCDAWKGGCMTFHQFPLPSISPSAGRRQRRGGARAGSRRASR